MTNDAMRCFLSEQTLTLHKRELDTARAALSIYQKSLPHIKEKSISEIQKMRIPTDYKQTILCKMRYIMLHEVYFSSFATSPILPKRLKEYYPSREGFLFSLSEAVRGMRDGFLCLYKTKGAPKISILNEDSSALCLAPTLAVDISEHAYFLDYAFSRDKYLKGALERLNLDVLF